MLQEGVTELRDCTQGTPATSVTGDEKHIKLRGLWVMVFAGSSKDTK